MTDANDAFPSKYLKANDLKGQAVPLTIFGHAFELIQGQDKNQNKKLVLYFYGRDGSQMQKGLVLNRTNATKITELTGTSTVEEWTGQRIALYPSVTTYQGKEVPCIRVKAAPTPSVPPAPVEPPKVLDSDIPFACLLPLLLPLMASLVS